MPAYTISRTDVRHWILARHAHQGQLCAQQNVFSKIHHKVTILSVPGGGAQFLGNTYSEKVEERNADDAA